MSVTTNHQADYPYALPWLLLSILLLVLYRWWVLTHHGYTLYVDEAYYWTWSKTLEWGYYSKPPMIAAIIAASTTLCGDSAACVRSGALLLHPLSALLLYLLAGRMFGRAVGLWAALIYISMPAVALSSLIISTDVPLLLFWSAALYAFWRALQQNSTLWWMLAAIGLGLGLLSKYNMLLFGLCALLYLLSCKRLTGWWRDWRPWAATVLALTLLAPNIWWNAVNDWPTLLHTAHISKLDRQGLQVGEFLGFLLSQFAVFGPLLFGALVWIMLDWKSLWRDERLRFLLLFSLPFLAIICVQALMGRAHANWAAPTYAAGAILLAARLLQTGRLKLLIAGVLLNLALSVAFYHYDSLSQALGLRLQKANDPFYRLRGWDEYGRRMQAWREQAPRHLFLSHDRTLLSHLQYELRLDDRQLAAWNPGPGYRHQFDLRYDIETRPAEAYLYLSKGPLGADVQAGFESVRLLAREDIPIYPDLTRPVYVYEVKGFRGYP